MIQIELVEKSGDRFRIGSLAIFIAFSAGDGQPYVHLSDLSGSQAVALIVRTNCSEASSLGITLSGRRSDCVSVNQKCLSNAS